MSPVDPLMQPVTNQETYLAPADRQEMLPEPVQTKTGLSTKQKVVVAGVSTVLSLALVVGIFSFIANYKANTYQSQLQANSHVVVL